MNPLGAYSGTFASGPQSSWLAGTPDSAALVRRIEQFIQGAFGPAEPIRPQPIDVPPDGSPRPTARRLQYPIFWNLPVGIPGSEGIKVAPFQTMRNYAERYSVVRACIEVRKREMLGFDWDLVPTEPVEKQMRQDTALREDWMKRRNMLLEFWRRPDSDYAGFRSWFGACLEEVFVTDALSIGFESTLGKKAGMFGTNIKKLRLIDGTTIRPLHSMGGEIPAPPDPAYQQYIWGVPRVDLMQVMTEEDAEEAADDMDEYTTSELLYLPLTKRNWTPYGFSPVEMSLVPQAIGLSRQAYFLDYFQEGSIPGMFIVAGQEVASAAQRRQLQEALNSIAGDIGYKFRLVVLPHGSTSIPTKEIKLADGSDTIITELVMMCFGVYSEELSMVPGGRTSGLGGAGHQAGSDDIRRRNRTKPMAGQLKDSLFNFVNQQLFGQKDMDWSWVGMDESEDKFQKAQADKIYIDSGVVTRDEARGELGYEPFNLPLTGSPTVTGGKSGAVTPLDPGTPLTVEQGYQEEAPAPELPFGMDGEDPEDGGDTGGAAPPHQGGGNGGALHQGDVPQKPMAPGAGKLAHKGFGAPPASRAKGDDAPTPSRPKQDAEVKPVGKPAQVVDHEGKPHDPAKQMVDPNSGKPLPPGASAMRHDGKPVDEQGNVVGAPHPGYDPSAGEPMHQGDVPMGMNVQEHQQAGHIPTKDQLAVVQQPDAVEGQMGGKDDPKATVSASGQHSESDPKAGPKANPKVDPKTGRPIPQPHDPAQGHISPGKSDIPARKEMLAALEKHTEMGNRILDLLQQEMQQKPVKKRKKNKMAKALAMMAARQPVAPSITFAEGAIRMPDVHVGGPQFGEGAFKMPKIELNPNIEVQAPAQPRRVDVKRNTDGSLSVDKEY